MTAGPNAGRVSKQPGLLIITGRHYSTAFVNSVEARPLVSESPTDEELGRAFGPYVSNAGTYEVSGSTVTQHGLVAKNPGTMAPGSSGTWEITELTADTLEYTGGGPGGNTFRSEYSRVE